MIKEERSEPCSALSSGGFRIADNDDVSQFQVAASSVQTLTTFRVTLARVLPGSQSEFL